MKFKTKHQIHLVSDIAYKQSKGNFVRISSFHCNLLDMARYKIVHG